MTNIYFEVKPKNDEQNYSSTPSNFRESGKHSQWKIDRPSNHWIKIYEFPESRWHKTDTLSLMAPDCYFCS
ncbi:hypothetical protein [Limnoraphis robusta]|uniref:Uncharacterized protein n=1 Tax=Limnoraphis robusta CCNP1315 TaxID=3110306 RepID=A0ABU5TV65_9CYAN|nr:hypothetical protein [Limnoraphis robusta]MEA5518792.1 hypothetical protein [Limnoraphis robusta CCNP1315]MEA5547572.1 hypothetical protein [Limnoraphis robusta CCNP1324]